MNGFGDLGKYHIEEFNARLAQYNSHQKSKKLPREKCKCENCKWTGKKLEILQKTMIGYSEYRKKDDDRVDWDSLILEVLNKEEEDLKEDERPGPSHSNRRQHSREDEIPSPPKKRKVEEKEEEMEDEEEDWEDDGAGPAPLPIEKYLEDEEEMEEEQEIEEDESGRNEIKQLIETQRMEEDGGGPQMEEEEKEEKRQQHV